MIEFLKHLFVASWRPKKGFGLWYKENVRGIGLLFKEYSDRSRYVLACNFSTILNLFYMKALFYGIQEHKLMIESPVVKYPSLINSEGLMSKVL